MKTQPNVLQVPGDRKHQDDGVSTGDSGVRDVKGRTLIKMLLAIFIFFIVSVCVVGKE